MTTQTRLAAGTGAPRPGAGSASGPGRPGPALPPTVTAAAADEALRDPKGPNRHSGAAAAGRAWPAGAALAGCQWASVSNFKFKIARNRDTDSGVGPDSVGLIPGRSAVGVGPKRPLARLGRAAGAACRKRPDS